MGMFKVAVKVTNPAEPKRFFEEEFWVDTAQSTRSCPRIAWKRSV